MYFIVKGFPGCYLDSLAITRHKIEYICLQARRGKKGLLGLHPTSFESGGLAGILWISDIHMLANSNLKET